MDLVIPKKDLLRLVARCHGVADKKSAMPAINSKIQHALNCACLTVPSVLHTIILVRGLLGPSDRWITV